jgi:hypothetical protein
MISGSICNICKTRRSTNSVSLNEQIAAEWECAYPLTDHPEFCGACCGILQFGGPILSRFRESFKANSYADIYSCPLSVQLPQIMVFRSMIERAVYHDDSNPQFIDVREILRSLLYRHIQEKVDDRMPKLFCDVQINMPAIYHEVTSGDGMVTKTRKSVSSMDLPTEMVSAVNQRMKSSSRHFKKFKDKYSVSIGDIQAFAESVRGDITKLFRALLPAKSEVTEESEMKRILSESFLSTPSGFYPEITVTLRRDTIHLVGKYNKLCRNFGQSQWDANSTSVAESICPVICDLFKAPVDKCLFSASGREDMDVRMLGNGRTFVLQLGDAHCLHPLLDKTLLSDFFVETGDVRVQGGLRHVDRGVLDWLHWSTEQHLKVYRCVVWSGEVFPPTTESILASVKNLKVFQKTPMRVLHRRSDNVREKYIHSISMEILNPHFGIVTLHASAGAYIKEFIHGDLGRTKPSFSDVVFGKQTKCDILQLDVLEVEQDEDEAYVPLWER